MLKGQGQNAIGYRPTCTQFLQEHYIVLTTLFCMGATVTGNEAI
jgi:hypothetical protein